MRLKVRRDPQDKLLPALVKSVRRVGQPGGLFYTERQLYYEVCRELQHERPGWLRLVRTSWRVAPISYESFLKAFGEYISKVGRPPGLIPESPGPVGPAVVAHEPDLFDYGLPCLLVCQHDYIARMLLANYIHMELSCVILGLKAAMPIPNAVAAMLARAEDPCVYLLHDASIDELSLALQFPDLAQLPTDMPWVDIGLRADHARGTGLSLLKGDSQETDAVKRFGHLSRRDMAWLKAGWHAEVAAMRPAELIRFLFRAIGRGKSD